MDIKEISTTSGEKKLCKCNIEPYMKQKDEKKMN